MKNGISPKRKITLVTEIFCLWLIVIFNCREIHAQSFEDKALRGNLYRWNIYPLDSLWQFYPEIESAPVILNNTDTGGQLVNTEFLQYENGEALKWDGIGWFRKKFTVPPTLLNKPVAFRMVHYGASEIYLDDKLIHRYGTVSKMNVREIAFIPRNQIIISLDSQSSHILSVHYSNKHGNAPGPGSKFLGFRVLMAPAADSAPPGASEVETIPITIIVLLIFGFFFLFVYFFDVKRLASLLTSLMMFVYSLLFVGTFLGMTETGIGGFKLGARLISISSISTNCIQLLVLYALYYNGKLPRRSLLMLAIFLPILFFPKFPMPVYVAEIILLDFEIFRILILGLIKKKTGFWILLTGIMIQQSGFFIFVQDVFNLFPIMTRTHEILLMVFPQMGIPLTYSLHLAWEFGTANRDLRSQLVQVNALSEKSLRQEKEKQEILHEQKEKLELMVSDRTKELSQQKETLVHTLTDLKATQNQLIQSEKMASLGELTAGIAHEIQNPLNFVNNFSELSGELIDEVAGSRQEAGENSPLVSEFLADIKQNLEKINHHGKRADAIVKGMLQHSQKSSGEKEPTDINALVDEYLRLAYNGTRAKDSSFDAVLKTDFDKSIGNINIIPRDIARVLLNLYNNAFWAVSEKQKTETGNSRDNPCVVSYQPQVSVSTRRNGNQIVITVTDNGNGVPEKLVDKIFQPFFTTKPTGQGTGLGLSLSYDIVKAHGGEILLKNVPGGGAEFIITLPFNG